MNQSSDQTVMPPANPASHLTSGHLLAKNTIWNLLGLLSPMVVAVLTIPPLVRGLGIARFGVLSLAWVIIGYFSLFDLGIGRALTKLLADKLGANEESSIPPLAWTSLLLLLLLGVFAGLVMLALAPWLVHKALRVPEPLQPEILNGFYLLALSLPIVTVTSGLRGILEALQRFRILNLIRIPTSVFSFAGPLLVLPFSHSLFPVIIILVIGRIIGVVVHLLACFYALPALRQNFVVQSSIIVPLAKFGGWMTVSNLAAPIIVYVDRFLISALLSVGAVAYYTAPFDIVNRLLVIPGAIASVLFPAFAMSLMQDPGRAELLLSRGVKYVFFAVFPIILVIAAFAPEGLRLWLGPAFAGSSSSVLRWLAAGVFVNSLAHVPFGLVQGAGRPDISAKLQLAELPVYLLVFWLLVRAYGIEGAAMAWTARVAVDALLLFFFSHRLVPYRPRFLWKLSATVAAGLLAIYTATLFSNVVVKAAFIISGLIIFGLVSWSRGLTPGERAFMVDRVRRNAKQPALPKVALTPPQDIR